jgi:hypothetical protein
MVNNANYTNNVLLSEILAMKAQEKHPNTTMGPALLQHSARKFTSPEAVEKPKGKPPEVKNEKNKGSVTIVEGRE